MRPRPRGLVVSSRVLLQLVLEAFPRLRKRSKGGLKDPPSHQAVQLAAREKIERQTLQRRRTKRYKRVRREDETQPRLVLGATHPQLHLDLTRLNPLPSRGWLRGTPRINSKVSEQFTRTWRRRSWEKPKTTPRVK